MVPVANEIIEDELFPEMINLLLTVTVVPKVKVIIPLEELNNSSL